MFVAKFSETSGAPFVADKNGNYPFIGEVKAGTARGTIMNGTMFKRAGLRTDALYACENVDNAEYPDNVQTEVLERISALDYPDYRTKLGAPHVKLGASVVNAEEEIPTV